MAGTIPIIINWGLRPPFFCGIRLAWARQVRPGSSRVGRGPSRPQALEAAGRNKIYINAKRPQAARAASGPDLVCPNPPWPQVAGPAQKKIEIFVPIPWHFAL